MDSTSLKPCWWRVWAAASSPEGHTPWSSVSVLADAELLWLLAPVPAPYLQPGWPFSTWIGWQVAHLRVRLEKTFSSHQHREGLGLSMGSGEGRPSEVITVVSCEWHRDGIVIASSTRWERSRALGCQLMPI